MKQAVSVLTKAAGLVSSNQYSSKDPGTPVPGFPEYVFAADGQPAALRELAKSYQVRAHCPMYSTDVHVSSRHWLTFTVHCFGIAVLRVVTTAEQLRLGDLGSNFATVPAAGLQYLHALHVAAMCR